MASVIEIIKVCAILVASIVLGNWFFAEVKASKRRGDPWYAPYFSIPGILIISVIVLAPILVWLLHP